MKKFSLDRRTFLRGVGGFALGLPMLEAMVDARPAYAQGSVKKRYVIDDLGPIDGPGLEQRGFLRSCGGGSAERTDDAAGARRPH